MPRTISGKMEVSMSNKLLHNGFCPVCGQPILNVTRMKDGTICAECAAKIRVMFPVHYEKSTVKGSNPVCVDPLKDIAVNNYEETLQKARAYRESLREKYNGYNAVYVVDNVEVEQGSGVFASPVLNVYGHVLYGTYFLEDDAILLHGDNQIQISLLYGKIINSSSPAPITSEDIKDRERRFIFKWQYDGTAQEGYPFQFAFINKNLPVEAGDLIVK